MKKLLGIVVLVLLSGSNAYTDHKGWPHGKKWAYNCASTTECNIKIENIKEQPKLFIGKSTFDGKNSVKNIAYKGKTIKPNNMLGVWGRRLEKFRCIYTSKWKRTNCNVSSV